MINYFVNPPDNYTLEELAADVRNLLEHLHKCGIFGLKPGIDFDTIAIYTDQDEVFNIPIDGAMLLDVPEHIVRMIRWYSGRLNLD